MEISNFGRNCLQNTTYESTLYLNLRNIGNESISAPYQISLKGLQFFGARDAVNFRLNSSQPLKG